MFENNIKKNSLVACHAIAVPPFFLRFKFALIPLRNYRIIGGRADLHRSYLGLIREQEICKRIRKSTNNLRFYQADFAKIKEKERAISQRPLTRSLFICISRNIMVLAPSPT